MMLAQVSEWDAGTWVGVIGVGLVVLTSILVPTIWWAARVDKRITDAVSEERKAAHAAWTEDREKERLERESERRSAAETAARMTDAMGKLTLELATLRGRLEEGVGGQVRRIESDILDLREAKHAAAGGISRHDGEIIRIKERLDDDAKARLSLATAVDGLKDELAALRALKANRASR